MGRGCGGSGKTDVGDGSRDMISEVDGTPGVHFLKFIVALLKYVNTIFCLIFPLEKKYAKLYKIYTYMYK